MNKIDARGLSCPAPVLQTKAAIEGERPHQIEVVVDNECAQENVSRFLESQGYRAEVKKADNAFTVMGTGDGFLQQPGTNEKSSASSENKIMVLISSDRMGKGDDVLGRKLMTSFIKTLQEMGYEIVPVPVYYPDVKEILGEKVYRSVAEIPGDVDIVDVFRRPDDIPPHLPDFIAKKPKAVWFQLGIRNDVAAVELASAGITVVQNRCLKIEAQNLEGR